MDIRLTTIAGIMFFCGTAVRAQTAWDISGNAQTSPGTHFIGTTDFRDLVFKVNGTQAGWLNLGNNNNAWGIGSLGSSPYGYNNTATGNYSLQNNTSGSYNTAHGMLSLQNNISGGFNLGMGVQALQMNTAGSQNTAVGALALSSVTTVNYSTAIGSQSLRANTSGANNTGVGALALIYNVDGGNNTAVGMQSLSSNNSGSDNTATGFQSLLYNGGNGYSGSFNTAYGSSSLLLHSGGNNNTGVGYGALYHDLTGSSNTALGANADVGKNYLTGATAIGANAVAGENNSTAIGSNALASLPNTLVLGGTGAYAVNVGIGTPSPGARLHVISGGSPLNVPNTAFTGDMVIQSSAAKSTTNGVSLEFALPAGANATNPWGQARIMAHPASTADGDATGTMVIGTRRVVNGAWAYGNDITVDGQGFVTVGAQSTVPQSGYILNVWGSVRANKLTVNTSGADFVFEPSYKLRPLAEVEGYVKQNKHLPGIAPANQMQRDGVEVGDTQTKLLQKIEELTLYAIAQDRKQESQQQLILEQGRLLKEQRELLSGIQKKVEGLQRK